MSVVIYHERDGIYLGCCMGLGFWTKMDSAGQPAAVTFPSVEAAEAHMATWECGRPADVTFVEVEADAEGFADVAACVRAGLPGWLDETMPVANALPA